MSQANNKPEQKLYELLGRLCSNKETHAALRDAFTDLFADSVEAHRFLAVQALMDETMKPRAFIEYGRSEAYADILNFLDQKK